MDEWLNDWLTEDDVSTLSDDPFDGINKADQDLFFKMLDLMPEEHRDEAMDYYMSRPSKLKAIIKNIKIKKELIKNKDQAGLNQLLDREYQIIEQAKQLTKFAENDNTNNEDLLNQAGY
ncbi:MAG: hypothetical protein WCW27_03645 [Patescibacteria group bacterium]|jgi:hypothetical protein